MAITSTVSNQIGGGLLIIINDLSYLQGSIVEVRYTYGLSTDTLIKSIECPGDTQQVIIRLPLSDLNSLYGESGSIRLVVKRSDGTTTPVQNGMITYDYSDYIQRTTWRSFKFDNY